MVTVIYSWSLWNYLREGKDGGFDWFVWIALDVGQKAVLAASLMPEAALFWRSIAWHCWPHWFPWYVNLGFWVWFDALRICDFVCFTISQWVSVELPFWALVSFRTWHASLPTSASTQILTRVFHAFSCASSTHLRSHNAYNIEGIQTVYSTSILRKHQLIT